MICIEDAPQYFCLIQSPSLKLFVVFDSLYSLVGLYAKGISSRAIVDAQVTSASTAPQLQKHSTTSPASTFQWSKLCHCIISRNKEIDSCYNHASIA